MSEDTNHNYEIQKSVYDTQWANIRHHWGQTSAGIMYLSTLVALAIVPIQLLSVSEKSAADLGINAGLHCSVKLFIAGVILSFAFVTFLNQYNHYKRSHEARNVVVEIEKIWNLYDEQDRFIFQSEDTKYSYSKFAGGERRLTYSKIQFSYIFLITAASLVFLYFV